MSLGLLEAHETDDGIAVTFITESGLEPLEGTYAEIDRLAEVMRQVSAMASLNESESVWVEDVTVGDATVRLGLNPGGLTRIQIVRPQHART